MKPTYLGQNTDRKTKKHNLFTLVFSAENCQPPRLRKFVPNKRGGQQKSRKNANGDPRLIGTQE